MNAANTGSHPVRVSVSVALDTGLWATPAIRALQHDRAPSDANKLFTSTHLTGATATPSVVRRASSTDLVTSLDQHLAASTSRDVLAVLDVVEVDRDIDGGTLLVDLAMRSLPAWGELAKVADDVVDWSDREAGSARQRRLDWGYVPTGTDGAAGTIGRLPTALWAHTVVICHVGTTVSDHRCDESVARALLPSDFETVNLRDTRAYLALHASLVCTRELDHGLRAAQLMDELHGWWTATWTLDHELLGTTMRMSATLAAGHYEELSSSADLLAEVTTNTGILHTRADSFRLSLGGFEWPIWDAAARKWELDKNFEALDRKRAVLSDITGAFRSALEVHHAVRLNQLAGFFAVVSALASFVAVMLFLYPTLDDSTDTRWRLLLIAASLMLSTAVILWSSRLVLVMSRRAKNKAG